MSMTMKHVQKHITPETPVHIVMIVFAAASVSNIRSYFESSGHDWLASLAIGGSLGLVLVSVSIMLTKVDFDHERHTFYAVGGITIAVALLSGYVQMLSYQTHISNRQAFVLGFGLPLVGECALAVGTSLFTAARKRQQIRGVTDNTETVIAEAIADALRDVDVSKVKRYAERRVDEIVRHQVDKVALLYLPDTLPDVTEHHQPMDDTEQLGCTTSPKMNNLHDPIQPSLDTANEQRQTIVVQRKDAIMNILHAHGSMGVSDIIDHLSDDLKAKRGAITGNLKQLADEGKLYNANREWHLILSSELPHIPRTESMSAPATQMNGYHG